MFELDKSKFKLLNNISQISFEINNLVENIPSKDLFYKDELRREMNNIIKFIVEMNEVKSFDDKVYFENLNAKLTSSLSLIDHMLEIIYKKKYINQNNLTKIVFKLNTIQKIIYTWKKNFIDEDKDK